MGNTKDDKTTETALFAPTPTVTGDYPSTRAEAPMGDAKVPKNEVKQARREVGADIHKQPQSKMIDEKGPVNFVKDSSHPIVDTATAENVLEHHAN